MLQKTVLKNGLRIVSEKIPHVRSVSIGIWVGSGSGNESAENNGISHLIEHMMFKGTKKRSAKDIAECIDSIGGQLNAFTGKECTCYYAKTLDSHIDIAMDVLADMFFNSRFSKRDLNIERKVIVEEIGMYEDSPEDLVQDMLSETVWRGNSLGYPILGTKESLESIDREKIREFHGYFSALKNSSDRYFEKLFGYTPAGRENAGTEAASPAGAEGGDALGMGRGARAGRESR